MSEKQTYLNKLNVQIQEAQGVLDKLKAERDELREQAQHEEIEHLEQHLADARIKFKDLADIAEDSWLDLQESLDKLLIDLRESIQKFLRRS
ncbi:MAG: hypothetical protein AAFY57_10930 [Cyanobacteria bacterium J06642_2]